jgi:hypothetical protein
VIAPKSPIAFVASSSFDENIMKTEVFGPGAGSGPVFVGSFFDSLLSTSTTNVAKASWTFDESLVEI